MQIIFHNSTKFPFPNQTNSLQFHYTRTQTNTQKLSVTKSKAVTKNSHLHNPYSKQKSIKPHSMQLKGLKHPASFSSKNKKIKMKN